MGAPLPGEAPLLRLPGWNALPLLSLSLAFPSYSGFLQEFTACLVSRERLARAHLGSGGSNFQQPGSAGEVPLPSCCGRLPAWRFRGRLWVWGPGSAQSTGDKDHPEKPPVRGCKYFGAPGKKPSLLSCPWGSLHLLLLRKQKPGLRLREASFSPWSIAESPRVCSWGQEVVFSEAQVWSSLLVLDLLWNEK